MIPTVGEVAVGSPTIILTPIKHNRLRAQKHRASRVEDVCGHVIPIRPDTELRVIKEVAGKMKTVTKRGAGGIAGLRNGDALVLRNTGAARSGELADDPSIGELVVDHHRITAAAKLTGAAKAGPDRTDRNGSEKRCASELIKNLEACVDHLDVLSLSHLAIRIRRCAVAADAREGECPPTGEWGWGNCRDAYQCSPETALNNRVGAVLVLTRQFRVEIRFMLYFCRRPDQRLFTQRPRQIAVQRRDHGGLAKLLSFRFLSCVRLGGGIRERARAQQRDENAGEYKN